MRPRRSPVFEDYAAPRPPHGPPLDVQQWDLCAPMWAAPLDGGLTFRRVRVDPLAEVLAQAPTALEGYAWHPGDFERIARAAFANNPEWRKLARLKVALLPLAPAPPAATF